MANVSVFLSDFQTGRSSSSVEVRLLRFWETRNVRHDGELMGVDMLLLDSRKQHQATMLPVTVNVHRLATHMPHLKAGVKFTFKKTMVKDKKQSSNALGVANVPITEASIHCGYTIR
ncbi:uncharacterized protein LOC111212762 [Brassica napus]|uniref:uncharacterized protein LOC111212160 n=1 Tax=Brassica napus TaxID=3708 RepID=UPI000BBE67C0|nr:uncharacterized protein LOC111212160 [Brassica napus]XP_022570070.1 uncharacterized protein LOC111212762 [Brassica napus]